MQSNYPVQNIRHTGLFTYAFMRAYGLELFESKLKMPQKKTIPFKAPRLFLLRAMTFFSALKYFVLIP